MKKYRISPKEWYGEKYIMDYIDWTKKEAIKLYLEKFPMLKRNEIEVH